MSTFIIEVCGVDEVIAHPNADSLDLLKIKGWTCIVKKNSFKLGDKCVFFPPETVLPEELATRLNVSRYLKLLPMFQGWRPKGGRVRVTSLRGERSYGLVVTPDNPEWTIGTNVVEHYQVTKYDPPETCTDGDSRKTLPDLLVYTDIENYRNFPNEFTEGEEVVYTEKLHGSNCRVTLLRTIGESGEETFQYHCASHRVNRRQYDANGGVTTFWRVLTEEMKALLKDLCQEQNNVIIFGELLGLQDMKYGLKYGDLGFRCFDISVNGQYLDFDKRIALCGEYNIPYVPVLYRGPHSLKVLEQHTDGPTVLCPVEDAGEFRGREGIVITPVKERRNSEGGRLILKSVSFDYLNRKEN